MFFCFADSLQSMNRHRPEIQISPKGDRGCKNKWQKKELWKQHSVKGKNKTV